MHPAPSIIAFTTLSGLGFGLMAWLGIGAEPLGPPARLPPLRPRRRPRRLRPPRQPPPPRPAPPLPQGLQPVAHLLAQPRGRPRRRHLRRLRPLRRALGPLRHPHPLARRPRRRARARHRLRHLDDLRPAAQRPPLALAPDARSSSSSSPSPAARSSPAPRAPPPGSSPPSASPSSPPGSRATAASPAPARTLATATGLGALGRLRLLAPPHTGANYLLREMVYVVGRRHALKLRVAGLPPRRRSCPSRSPSPPTPLTLAAGRARARRRAPSSCAGSSSRRRSTWLDSTTEGAKTPGVYPEDVSPPHAQGQAQAQHAPPHPRRASRRGCRWRRSAGGARPRGCASCSSPAATPAAG